MDVTSQGFECAYKKQSRFLTYEQGADLICASPQDTELFLKACKKGIYLPITVCSVDIVDINFPKGECTEISGKITYSPINDLENWVCLSPQDKERLLERCHT